MKTVKFFVSLGFAGCDREEEMDLLADLGMTPKEWEEASDDEKLSLVREWASEYLEMWWEEAGGGE